MSISTALSAVIALLAVFIERHIKLLQTRTVKQQRASKAVDLWPYTRVIILSVFSGISAIIAVEVENVNEFPRIFLFFGLVLLEALGSRLVKLTGLPADAPNALHVLLLLAVLFNYSVTAVSRGGELWTCFVFSILAFGCKTFDAYYSIELQ